MRVVGAGMAGLLAAGMLRGECEEVIEAKESLPDNHSAVLRFKTSIVGDALNIPFKKVKVIKAIQPWKNPIADVLAYSNKVIGSYALRSITSATGDLVERWIAPENFPAKMAETVQAPIHFNTKWTGPLKGDGPFISTLPMPVLMKILGWDGIPQFGSIRGLTITATIERCDMYCSLYIPSPQIGPYRVSINKNQLIIEVGLDDDLDFEELGKHEDWLEQAIEAIGIPISRLRNLKHKQQAYMKLLPIDEDIRKRFIMWASDNHQVYSLGRFATWRPGLLLDDLVNDVRVIQRIHQSTNYSHRSKP